jgi:hypothetical protein
MPLPILLMALLMALCLAFSVITLLSLLNLITSLSRDMKRICKKIINDIDIVAVAMLGNHVVVMISHHSPINYLF